MRAFAPVSALRHLKDVLTTDRADGRILAWDDTEQAYVHVDQAGSEPAYWRHFLAGG